MEIMGGNIAVARGDKDLWLAEKETFVLESNSTTTTKNVSINVSAAQLASMHSFVIEFVYPSGNQSTFFYYINNVSYQISPRN